MNERIRELRSEGEAAIAGAPGTTELEEVRVRFLGRKAELPNLLRGVAQLPADQRGQVGLAADVVDVTLPGTPSLAPGRLHLLTATWRELEDVFMGLGFRVVEGPESDLVYYNFDALNHNPQHPARLPSDTFYVNDDVVLRTHTSPMQIRVMEQHPPPLYIIVPGRTYR